MISIPESVGFYWADPTNKAAVNVLADHLPADRTGIPPDLTLEEAERFEVASLAAQRIRVDLWRLLGSIWSATWATSVLSEFPAARLLTYRGHSEYLGGNWIPSVKRAWDDGTRYGIFDLPGRGHLVTFVRLTGNDQSLELGFSLADPNEDWSVSDEVDLGTAWTTDDEGWRVAGSGHIRMAGGGVEIDPSSLAALCQSALAALKSALA